MKNLVKLVFSVVRKMICDGLGRTEMVCNARKHESNCRFMVVFFLAFWKGDFENLSESPFQNTI